MELYDSMRCRRSSERGASEVQGSDQVRGGMSGTRLQHPNQQGAWLNDLQIHGSGCTEFNPPENYSNSLGKDPVAK